ncbi:MAG: hypothetical protein ACR2P0_19520, partial [Acidimicrobiales bacterium]
YLSGELADIPAIDAEVMFRAQGLDAPPDPREVLDAMPAASPRIGRTELTIVGGPTIETVFDSDLTSAHYAIDLGYEGSFELHADVLADGNRLDALFNMTGGWISSTLVSLSDAV